MMRGAVWYTLLVMSVILPAGLSHAVSQTEVEALQQQSDQKKMEYKKLQAESVALSLELAKMNKQLVEAAKRIQKDEDGITKTESELKLLQEKVRVSEEEFNRKYQNLAQMLAAIQDLALHTTDSLILQPLTPVEIIQSAILMRDSVPYLHESSSKIRKDLEALHAQKEAAQKKLMELSDKTQNLKKEQVSIKKLAEQKNNLREKLEGQKNQAREDALKLASEASDLKDLMEKALKEADLKRRKEDEVKRAARERELEVQRKLEEEQLKRIREHRAYGFENQDTVTDDDSDTQGVDNAGYDVIQSSTSKALPKTLSAAKQFVRPVRGNIVTNYGQELSKGVASKGIVIKTRPQAQVVAPYDGTVVFSGPFKGYGQLIIIEHVADIVSLVAGMSSVDTQNGQMVLAGEPVGLMPDTAEAKLYMEIRKDKKTINPAAWLGQ
ncbi:MAG: peptidoglycan DD-metalloendopeptidase family protein [Alphaproteobacteria bacterium]|nr:peptidoglycan DD-metalloendopeptidase family protein [Alphaproteobacteria bacterium]